MDAAEEEPTGCEIVLEEDDDTAEVVEDVGEECEVAANDNDDNEDEIDDNAGKMDEADNADEVALSDDCVARDSE